MTLITVSSLRKAFGSVRALDDVSFVVRAGAISGLLGPNGAGKTTTLRILLGLAHADSGTALIDGRPYASLDEPLRTVGAVGEDVRFHPGRTGRDQLRIVAATVAAPPARVDELLALVDLAGDGRRAIGGYSLGMRQRLALAAALLPDPRVLVLDEPMNGLDPHGVRWLRDLLRAEASAGRAVLISSHQLAEMAQLVDDVVVLDRGRVVSAGHIDDLLLGDVVEAATDRADELVAALEEAGVAAENTGAGVVRARGTTPEVVGRIAADRGIPLRALGPRTGSLEDAFVSLTRKDA
jgi:ABC-2 type transport system ATP-binding protein